MISEDKLRDQALGYTVIPGYDSWPYEGPGRWAVIDPELDLTVWTNDKTAVAVIAVLSCNEMRPLLDRRDELYAAGKSATEAFDILTEGLDIVTGDLAKAPFKPAHLK
ncbi:hypothetical protein [Gordonia sp. (in: high G+C Gram-positive bacteria)]|jgi:hypothetical protein|uniref:hypothetical protein n=1 Tax=Gordonia sp. (in: high G+C Gram-positive bacteria) TaxID=84139 RepID=UPI001E0428E1|nr:hypothetical protein [Gordonia sp. (in: high G+C Gram-positive bacteria)]MCB1294284.1 hypothetical protein [Gordonia sp. (in: high G+C Gram-positive bacteria)]HMS77213.1 hypothetical protein [Gordonia sp. (in: high G+C Gram-positive bacteria)]HQV19685.1 hypothetical protein [Gordonia sp. (in: high G+C Gram-positive bacteria)]